MVDNLGDRMKSFYEDRTRYYLPRRTYTIIRIDGKAFHTYTKNLIKPFDSDFMEDMDLTTLYLCQKIMNTKMAFVQSDEISLLLSDFDNLNTESWFDGNIQKMVSVSASMATSFFNKARLLRNNFPLYASNIEKIKLAEFDSRVCIIPSKVEVENYFIWRQQDASRNSVSSVAQSLYSQNELLKKNNSEQQEMIFQKGINWNNYSSHYKRGRVIIRNKDSSWDVLKDTPLFTGEERKAFFEIIPVLD